MAPPTFPTSLAGVCLISLGTACPTKSTDTGTSEATGPSSTSGSTDESGTTGLMTTGGSGTECGGPLSHSEMVGDDCVCDSGYEWCNPADPDDFSCCEYEQSCPSGENNHVNGEGNCECNAGYTWCNPDDVADLNCCPIDG